MDRVQLIVTESNHLFPGFSVSEGVWSSPELLDILLEIDDLAELKVTVAVIVEASLRGSGAVIHFSDLDLEAVTGLERKEVLRGIKAALKRGILKMEAGP